MKNFKTRFFLLPYCKDNNDANFKSDDRYNAFLTTLVSRSIWIPWLDIFSPCFFFNRNQSIFIKLENLIPPNSLIHLQRTKRLRSASFMYKLIQHIKRITTTKYYSNTYTYHELCTTIKSNKSIKFSTMDHTMCGKTDVTRTCTVYKRSSTNRWHMKHSYNSWLRKMPVHIVFLEHD